MRKAEARKRVNKYIRGVTKGTIPAGRFIRLSAQRHARDLKHGKARGFIFDADAALHVVNFFPMFLRHSKGEWAGQPFHLEDWEVFILWCLFGWKRADGTRRYRSAYIELPRKNGKSTIGAGVGCYMTFGDKEPGAEVYSAATKRDQAKIVHEEAIRMVKASPDLAKHAKVTRENIAVPRSYSKYEPLGADADTIDGLNVHCAIIDELHAHKTRDVWDKLITATAARRNSLIFGITMAGADSEGLCADEHAYAGQILEGHVEADDHFAYIAAIDEGDRWDTKKAWAKANPNLGVSVKLDYLERACKKAKESPAYENTFRRFHCGQWVKQEVRYIPMDAWDACGPPKAASTLGADLSGGICFSGLDLASKIDIAALVHVFPDSASGGEGGLDVLARFWIPADNMAERIRRDRVPYDVWVRDGWIEATPGNVIDYRSIYRTIDRDAQAFDIEEMAFDRWGATQIIQELEEMGLDVVQFGQGYGSMSDPTKELLRLVLEGKLRHGGNPVLRWMADNLMVVTDDAENVKPTRKRSREKVDGIVALIMAIDRASRHGEAGSIYEDREPLFIGIDDDD